MTIPEPRITGPKTPLSRLGQRRDPLLAHLAHGPLQKLDPAGKPFELLDRDAVVAGVSRLDSLPRQTLDRAGSGFTSQTRGVPPRSRSGFSMYSLLQARNN